MNLKSSVTLGLTMGDPNGIGAEIILKALAKMRPFQEWQPLIIGDIEVLEQVNQQCRLGLQLNQDSNSQSPESISVKSITASLPRAYALGQINRWAGESSWCYIVEAVRLIKMGHISGMVTAPICKESLQLAGHFFPGHTELLSYLTNGAEAVMMLVVDKLRAIHVTTHMSLRAAIEALNKDKILNTIRIADKVLRQLGITNPRLGVPGLNPHAGENGLFGHEETEFILPAVIQAREEGIDCKGPISPDSIFIQLRAEVYDAVIALYHDQSHIPLKLWGFERGVNVTLGLPLIRTSVDHGTAFDLADKFQADPGSLIYAIQLAQRLVTSHTLS